MAHAGCSSGAVGLVLDFPDDAALAPLDPASVTLVASLPGATPRATTRTISRDGDFDLGELPVGDRIDLAVELRDATQRLVGYGRAADPVSVDPDRELDVVVPVRRPFVYVTGAGDQLVTFDSTREPSDGAYQGTVAAPLTATLAVPAGGDEVIVIGGGGDAHRLSTATHKPVDGAALKLPSAVRDAAASPDGRWLVIAHAGGISVAELATGTIADRGVKVAVDRVAIAADASGALVAVGLVDRATSPGCVTKSKLVTVPLDGSSAPVIVDTGRSIADVGASAQQAAVVGADSCANALVLLAGGDTSKPLVALSEPAAVAVLGSRAFAVGTVPGEVNSEGVTLVAAHLEVVAIGVDGSQLTKASMAPILESMVSKNVPGDQLARNLKAATAVPLDMAVVPPGDLVAVAYQAEFHGGSIIRRNPPPLPPSVVFPEMIATSNKYLLIDLGRASVIQQARTRCDLEVLLEQSDFPAWDCLAAPGQDTAAGRFTPSSVAVLYGAR